jgi:hypothetical protein
VLSIIRELRHNTWIVIARWTTLLASTDESSSVLQEIAAHADELNRLVTLLFPRIRFKGWKMTAQETASFIDSWLRYYVNSVVMTEGLGAMADGQMPPWSRSDSRNLLPDRERSYVASLEQNGLLGVLRPYGF